MWRVSNLSILIPGLCFWSPGSPSMVGKIGNIYLQGRRRLNRIHFIENREITCKTIETVIRSTACCLTIIARKPGNSEIPNPNPIAIPQDGKPSPQTWRVEIPKIIANIPRSELPADFAILTLVQIVFPRQVMVSAKKGINTKPKSDSLRVSFALLTYP